MVAVGSDGNRGRLVFTNHIFLCRLSSHLEGVEINLNIC